MNYSKYSEILSFRYEAIIVAMSLLFICTKSSLCDENVRLNFIDDIPVMNSMKIEPKLSFGFDAEFEIESYLRHQGDVFSEQFDANTYLLMTKILDYFDPANEHEGDLAAAFNSIEAQILVMSFSTDWRFSPDRSKEIVNALIKAKKKVSYIEVNSPHGHDSFLFADDAYVKGLSSFLEN